MLPFAVCIVNVTGDLNTGIIVRTASLMGAECVIVAGRRIYDKRSTVGAQNYIPVHRVDCLVDETTVDYDAVERTITQLGYTPVCVEHGGTLVRKFDFRSVDRPCLIFGNEGFGLPEEFTSRHRCVSIPQRGVLRSFNVSSAAAIVIDETVAQLTS